MTELSIDFAREFVNNLNTKSPEPCVGSGQECKNLLSTLLVLCKLGVGLQLPCGANGGVECIPVANAAIHGQQAAVGHFHGRYVVKAAVSVLCQGVFLSPGEAVVIADKRDLLEGSYVAIIGADQRTDGVQQQMSGRTGNVQAAPIALHHLFR